MKTLKFKSTHQVFRKECLGMKRNTIREFTEKDNREEILKAFIRGDISNLYIQITNLLGTESFIRQVTDVTKWKNWYIISW